MRSPEYRGTVRLRLHNTALPAMTPAHTAAKPSRTLRVTFSEAIRNWPSWTVRNVSYEKAEDVVYAPMKPMASRYVQFGLRCVLSARIVKIKPTRNDPETLITNVP